ncbi:MAG TPA: LptF/LptG family permease [Candidatus Limnocylindria bacterium]|nr:LptF/LptG family permease [Candidatus Limnocylindria bacterium]
MKVIHRYILSEIWGPYLIALFTFTLVTLLHRFSRLTDLVVAKGVPSQLVGKLLLSLLPQFLAITLPAALLLAVLLALGRLGADSETTALCTAGVGMRGLVLPVLLLSMATFLASLFIGWAGIPWGKRNLTESIARIVSVRAGAGVEEHVFRDVAPDVLLFPDRVSPDGTGMTGVMLSQRVEGQDPLLVFAKEGKFLPESIDRTAGLLLSDGTIHHDDRRTGAYRIASFREMEFYLPKRNVDAGGDRASPRHLTLPELARKISETEGTGSSANYRYHFHRRLSLAVSCLAFGLLAIPLGHSQRVRGKSPALALTLAVILFYYLFLAAAGTLESSSPALMTLLLWVPNSVGLAAACWLIWRSESRLVSLPDLFGRLERKK